MRVKIAIVNSKSFGKYSNAIEELKQYGEVIKKDLPKDIDGMRLAEELKQVNFVIASSTPRYDAYFFNNNKSVVAILVHGIGLDNIDVRSATEEGVVVAKVPGPIEREAVAELTIGLLLNVLRNITPASIKVREGKWADRAKYVGSELMNKTVGVIGVGNIGSRVAEILKNGFNVRILAYDPYIPPEKISNMGLKPASFDELLQESDIITIHCPLTKETYHMLDETAFKKMKDGVIIINTARGAIIDTSALINALEEGKVKAAALDVVEEEPVDPTNPLLRFENVLITPHIGAYTFEALIGMDTVLVEAVKALLKGEAPDNVVNKEVFDRPNLRLKVCFK